MYCFAFLIVIFVVLFAILMYIRSIERHRVAVAILAQTDVFLPRFARNSRSMPFVWFESCGVRQRLMQIFVPGLRVPFPLCYEQWFAWEFVGSMEPEEEEEEDVHDTDSAATLRLSGLHPPADDGADDASSLNPDGIGPDDISPDDTGGGDDIT